MNSTKFFLYSIFIFPVFFYGCERLNLKKEVLIKTSTDVNISLTEAWVNGQIYDIGEGIVEYGHCWSIERNPTARNFRTIYTDVSNEPFLSTLSGLKQRVWYHVRAYAIDKNSDTIYSENEADFIIENVWVELYGFPGAPRMGAFGFAIDDVGYFGGGITHEGSNVINLNDFWKFDPQNIDNYGWLTLPEYPGFPLYNTAFVINKTGYVFNGQEKTLIGYDPLNNLWFPRAELPDDKPRIDPFIFVFDNKAYLLGGSNSNRSFYYDPDINEWFEWYQCYSTGGRQNSYGFVIDNRIFVGGGFNDAENVYEPAIYREFYEYDFYNGIWIPKDSTVVNSYYPVSIAIENKGYVLDYDILWIFDPNDGPRGGWDQVEGLEYPRLFPVFINIGDIAYMFCGAYHPETDLSTWLRTPNTISDYLNWETLNDFWAYVPYAD